MNIRPFVPEDYPAFVTLSNAINPEYPITLERVPFQDEHHDPRCKSQRWVVEIDGQLIAYASYDQDPFTFHPQKFGIDIAVHPACQGRGLGSALYQRVIAALRPLDPLKIRARVREDWIKSLRFLQARGFQEEVRAWESRLDVAAFDPTRYAGHEDNLRAQGVVIQSVQELQTDPDRDRKLYKLLCELGRDVPEPEEYTPPSYESFLEHWLNHPNTLHDAYFVAVHHGDYIGSSTLVLAPATNDLNQYLTGVTPAYRRKGIALALKLHGIAYAKAHEHRVIRTENASINQPCWRSMSGWDLSSSQRGLRA